MEAMMAKAATLHDAFIDELRDAYDAEKQLTKALPKLAKAATAQDLRQAFETHLEETREHVTRLEQVFQNLGEKVRTKHCDGMEGILDEGKTVIDENFAELARDAVLIAAGQRAEHYEMAAYGTLVAWATAMGHTDAADLLQQTLDEEKAADEKLTALAEGGINESAAEQAHPEPMGMADRAGQDQSSRSMKEVGKNARPLVKAAGRSGARRA
jgi:ferritin-like metal-binding protein YciE